MNEMNTVAEWVGERISRAELFEDLGIDYCCGGNKTLNDACEELQLPVGDVLYRLQIPVESRADDAWLSFTPAELCDHIEKTHHAYLKDKLPRIALLLEKIVSSHGDDYRPLQETFLRFSRELESHMAKEEAEAFPLFRTSSPDRLRFINGLEHEHQEAGALLAELRKLTHHYKLPSHACMTLKRTWAELENLEMDMHLHVFKENHYLFTR